MHSNSFISSLLRPGNYCSESCCLHLVALKSVCTFVLPQPSDMTFCLAQHTHKKFSSKKPKYVFSLGNLVISSTCYSNRKLTLFLVSAKKLSIHLNFPVFLLLPIFSFTPLWSEKTLGMMTILSLSTCIVSYHSILEIAHFMCACKEFFYF